MERQGVARGAGAGAKEPDTRRGPGESGTCRSGPVSCGELPGRVCLWTTPRISREGSGRSRGDAWCGGAATRGIVPHEEKEKGRGRVVVRAHLARSGIRRARAVLRAPGDVDPAKLGRPAKAERERVGFSGRVLLLSVV